MMNYKLSPLARAYYEHYVGGGGGQRGGAFPVFRGAPYQSGSGLGEILRDSGKFLIPLASTAAQSFLESAASEMGKDKSIGLRDAAKRALKPTLAATAAKFADQILGGDPTDQSGTGVRRRKRRSGPAPRRKRARSAPAWQLGGGSPRKKRRTARALYKAPILARRTRRKPQKRNLLKPGYNF